jgi:3-dehydroquinate synthase
VEFLVWLEANMSGLRARDEALLVEAVYRSCVHKAEIVAADEQENGVRALLNLGHTFGHAIETGLGYGKWLHGEAVAAGTVMAARLSALMGWLREEDVVRVEQILQAAGLPIRGPQLDAARYLEWMRYDKKARGGKLHLVLLQSLGKAMMDDTASEAQICAAIEQTVRVEGRGHRERNQR